MSKSITTLPAASPAGGSVTTGRQLLASDLFDDEVKDLKQEVGKIMADPDGWLNTPNDQFAGRKPIDLIGTAEEHRLRDLIRAVKHGMSP